MWQKNIEIAINSFKTASIINAELVICGFVDQKSAEYLKSLKSLIGNTENIRIIANPSGINIE